MVGTTGCANPHTHQNPCLGQALCTSGSQTESSEEKDVQFHLEFHQGNGSRAESAPSLTFTASQREEHHAPTVLSTSRFTAGYR